MIYWIEWQFWSWKSSLATYIAKKVAKQTAKDIMKKLTLSWNVILSNIKMTEEFNNYFYFEDDKFLEILRTCNCINDIERHLYWEKNEKTWLINFYRWWFSKFYIFFDEVWAIMNNHLKLENNWVYAEYINQNRKNFEDIYIITAKWGQTNKTLRQMVDWWYYVNPLSWLPILRDFWVIRRQMKDEEGNIALEKYLWKDENGDYITKTRPIDEYVDFFWKPWIWKLYNDLHKNIKDPEKYSKMDEKLFLQILDRKRELIEPILKEVQFEKVKWKLPLLLLNEK